MPYVLIAHQNSPPYSAIAERLLEAQTDQVYHSQALSRHQSGVEPDVGGMSRTVALHRGIETPTWIQGETK